MLIIKVEGGKIDKAIKQMRRKVNNTKQRDEIRERAHFFKKSEVNRLKLQKAMYIQQKNQEALD